LRRESAWDEQRTQTEQLTHGWAPAKERDRKLTRPTRGGLWPSASHRFTPDYGLRRLSSGSFLGFSRGASRFGSARGSVRGGAAVIGRSRGRSMMGGPPPVIGRCRG